jgi:hypothetical protein
MSDAELDARALRVKPPAAVERLVGATVEGVSVVLIAASCGGDIGGISGVTAMTRGVQRT